MKKLRRFLKDIFSPDNFNDLDTAVIRESFNDPIVRAIWLADCLDELKRINLEVDKRLLAGTNVQLTDLCARRKAYQDVLESVLSARRLIVSGTQELRHNPQKVDINLDRVTT